VPILERTDTTNLLGVLVWIMILLAPIVVPIAFPFVRRKG
jgi:hypothetical protein